METAGCYVHIPFCVRKCAYCDFNSYSGYDDSSVRRYVDALDAEIRRTGPSDISVDTVFFGGGTPTAIRATDEARLLAAVRETLPLTPDAEITTEANPGTMDVAHLAVLRDAGFNRISFGVQSFDPGLLKTLDRIHTADEAKNAVKAARDAGFDNVSIDLMFALPRQTEAQWQSTLSEAFALGTDHISLYSLMVEEGTGFHTLYRKGRLPLPDNETAARMYEMAIDGARSAGYSMYEISNFARDGRECRHNLHYWRNESYYGFGCGAVAYWNGVRRTNVKLPSRYAEIVQAGGDPAFESECVTNDVSMAESMMLGLRLVDEGVDRGRFIDRHGIDVSDRYPAEIKEFTGRRLLEVDADRVRLTADGVFLATDVMAAFV